MAKVPTSRPLRSTVTRSQKARTSAILWVIMTTVSPRALTIRTMSPSQSTSWPDKRGRRLIEQENSRVAKERPRDFDALPLVEAEVADVGPQIDIRKRERLEMRRDRVARAFTIELAGRRRFGS